LLVSTATQAPLHDDIKVIVFDLDGTLYAGEAFLPDYLRLLGDLSGCDAVALQDEVDAILAGRHPVPVGAVHDAEDDRLIIAPGSEVTAVIGWSGDRFDTDSRVGAALGPLDGRVYLGDPWQVVRAVGRHHAIPEAVAAEAFRRVRLRINADPTAHVDVSELDDVLVETRDIEHRYVMTNTPEPLAAELVHRLGLPAWADEIHYDARKPDGLATWLLTLFNRHRVAPSSVMCIGDNLINDVRPALEAGARAIWIDPYRALQEEGQATRVDRLRAIGPILGSGHRLA
jgi:FMN phosphatase YigB (HAD superfamily)